MKTEVDYEKLIGNTPLIKLNHDIPNINIYAKLECCNPSGSMKDRSALRILKMLSNESHKSIKIIESSSGNFGIALASICSVYDIEFLCVVDKNINQQNKKILEILGAKVLMVEEKDNCGGYLQNRIKKVKEIIECDKGYVWTNQYDNNDMIVAYYDVFDEVYKKVKNIDYIFIPVSSGGTIAGISKRAKEINPKIKIIAVDVYGSVIFGGEPNTRYIPGMGSSIVAPNLSRACIDDVVKVSESEIIKGCDYLVDSNSILAGGSTGASYEAIKKYFYKKSKTANVLMLYCDRGERYMDTIYNSVWRKQYFGM